MVCPEQTLAQKKLDQCCHGNAPGQAPSTVSNLTCNSKPTRLRVPRRDGELLITPGLNQVTSGVAENQRIFEQGSMYFGDRPLKYRRALARREILELAREYTASLCPQAPPCTECSIDELLDSRTMYVTGHQPELFHPGVWAKDVIVDELAKRNQGISLNVVIDSDAVKSSNVSIPVNREGQFVSQRVPVDHWSMGMPWQDLQVADEGLFESFADRIEDQIPQMPGTTEVKSFWRDVVSETQHSGSVTRGLVAGRVRLERKMGINNYEVPISLIAATSGYRNFLAELILNVSKLQQVYNESLACYRKQYHIKSAMQPVPNLTEKDGWYELPIWIWSTGSSSRKSLYVKIESDRLSLSDLSHWEQQYPVDASSMDVEFISGVLLQLQNRGIQLRTKAMMTTAFLRLYLADWFVHGIGGAKYDEITDLIINNFWGLTAPGFQVATGTLCLPLENKPVAPLQSSNQLKQQLRHSEENPETLLSESQLGQATQLLEEKTELLLLQKQSRTEGLTRNQRRVKHAENQARYQKLKQVRSSLASLVDDQLVQMRQDVEEASRIEQELFVVNGREYPICCYPLETLRNFEAKIRTHQ